MYYISLDLEWNQAYFEQSQAVQKRLNLRLRGEVIQIGAVKLDENLKICGSFSVIVRPKFFRHIHRHVSRLTGITQQMIDRGTPLPEAAERFRRFCGEDSALLTWGPDDVPMFTDNLRAHALADDWVPPVYDLQVIYNMQTDGQDRQRSLEYAMEQFGIEQRLPAHDALNDAYFTALLAAKLDIARGIREYATHRGQYLLVEELGNADIGQTGFAKAEEILALPRVRAPRCPLCDKEMDKEGKLLHTKRQRYIQLCHCAEHGAMLQIVRLTRNLNETLRGKLTVEHATEETAAAHRAKLAILAQNSPSGKPRRRRRRRPSAATPTAQ